MSGPYRSFTNAVLNLDGITRVESRWFNGDLQIVAQCEHGWLAIEMSKKTARQVKARFVNRCFRQTLARLNDNPPEDLVNEPPPWVDER